MVDHRFRLLNVFAESPLAGNALAVFEDGRGLSDERMQALALQFNLSDPEAVRLRFGVRPRRYPTGLVA